MYLQCSLILLSFYYNSAYVHLYNHVMIALFVKNTTHIMNLFTNYALQKLRSSFTTKDCHQPTSPHNGVVSGMLSFMKPSFEETSFIKRTAFPGPSFKRFFLHYVKVIRNSFSFSCITFFCISISERKILMKIVSHTSLSVKRTRLREIIFNVRNILFYLRFA